MDPAGQAQEEALATRAPKLNKSDGRLDLTQPAEAVVRRIRGLWSWPGASCQFHSADGTRDETVVLARAEAVSADAMHKADGSAEPGTVVSDLAVATGSGALRILELKPAGGRLMTWEAYVNGRHVRPDDRFAAIDASE